jgi:hypothetical protein
MTFCLHGHSINRMHKPTCWVWCNDSSAEKMLGKRSVVLGLWRCLVLFCEFPQFPHVGAFSVLSKSDLVKCERTSVGGPVQNCKNKVLTTVTITNESRVNFVNLFHCTEKSRTYLSSFPCHFEIHCIMCEVRASPVVLYCKPGSGKRWKDVNCRSRQ